MLDANIKSQLKAYLEKLVAPIELVASLDQSAKSQELHQLLTEISELSDQVRLREDGSDPRRPSFSVGRLDQPARIRFAGLPLGHEFTSLVLALLQVGGHPSKAAPELLEQVQGTTTWLTKQCVACAHHYQPVGCEMPACPGMRTWHAPHN